MIIFLPDLTHSSRPPVTLTFWHWAFLQNPQQQNSSTRALKLGSIICLTTKFHETAERTRGKGPRQQEGEPQCLTPGQMCCCCQQPHASTLLCHPTPVSMATAQPPRRQQTLCPDTKSAAALTLPHLSITSELLTVAQRYHGWKAAARQQLCRCSPLIYLMVGTHRTRWAKEGCQCGALWRVKQLMW